MVTSKLTTKAQTVIPGPVREHLRVGPGDEISYELIAGGAVIRRAGGGRSLDDIDETAPVDLRPMQYDLDAPITKGIEGLTGIVLTPSDGVPFLSWAKTPTWRGAFERDLQHVANDSEDRPLLSTWLPLVTLRESFCGGGRDLQDATLQRLMERLRAQMRDWRAAGVDLVAVDGRLRR